MKIPLNKELLMAAILSMVLPALIGSKAFAISEAKLTASDAAAYDHFGWSVSISGDRAVVGSHYDDDAGTDSGSAYVFGHDGSAWVEEAKLTVSDAAAGDYFGWSYRSVATEWWLALMVTTMRAPIQARHMCSCTGVLLTSINLGLEDVSLENKSE